MQIVHRLYVCDRIGAFDLISRWWMLIACQDAKKLFHLCASFSANRLFSSGRTRIARTMRFCKVREENRGTISLIFPLQFRALVFAQETMHRIMKMIAFLDNNPARVADFYAPLGRIVWAHAASDFGKTQIFNRGNVLFHGCQHILRTERESNSRFFV